MSRIAAIALIVMAVGVVAQEATVKPTPEQCKTDAGAWYDYARDNQPMDKLSIEEVGRRIDAMAQCVSLTESEKEQSLYMEIIATYALEYRRRESHFIGRHDLWHTFLVEDAAGER
jgi:hypothetical protein